MTVLNPSTLRRLKKLPSIPSVWEGDRRQMSDESRSNLDKDKDTESGGDCIIWVDGSQGMVRSMDMVPAEIGPEAIVRTLLRAMEHPQSPTPSARPQKIVVKDREIQFFLRGVLQELDIVIDYVPDLPLIDEIFRGLQEVAESRPPQLPETFVSPVLEKAYQIWEDAPWDKLGEHQIISIKLNQFDLETLYISTLGKLGMDYGVLMYRSLESLKRFREMVIFNQPFDNLEEAFLAQDCLFVTFDPSSELLENEDEINVGALSASEIEPSFGNLHPLEGLRSIIYEEEATVIIIALEALHRFLEDFRYKLHEYSFPKLSKRYRIPDVTNNQGKKSISVTVETLPELADELMEMMQEAGDDEDDEFEFEFDGPILRNDLIPHKSFLSLGVMPWETVNYLRECTKFYQPSDGTIKEKGDGLPVVLIQTSKPKAKTLITNLQEAGGLTGICFDSAENSMDDCNYDLGILKTADGDLHLFGEFIEDDPTHQEARKKWDKRCRQTKGWCGLIIAMGLTGASRGQPGFKDMMALIEARSLSADDLVND